jgi:hypothetical protein
MKQNDTFQIEGGAIPTANENRRLDGPLLRAMTSDFGEAA